MKLRNYIASFLCRWRHSDGALAALALVLVSTLLAGCSSSSGIRIGWMESSGLKHKSAQYTSFDGVEQKTLHVKAGQTITLDYDVTVEKGTLVLAIVGPDGESLWEKPFHEDGSDTVALTASEQGLYTIHVEGENTSGGFDLSWSLSE